MAKTSKHTFTCFCDFPITMEVPDEIDLRENPETGKAIRDGTFLSTTCENCGKLLKPEFPLRITDKSRGIDIFLIPEDKRSAFLTGREKFPPADRIVIGIPELLEKITIYENELDDRALELIKFYLLQKAGKDSIELYFHKKKENSLILHIHGLKPKEIGVTKIPMSVYEKAKISVNTKKYDNAVEESLSPPYISVKPLSIEGVS